MLHNQDIVGGQSDNYGLHVQPLQQTSSNSTNTQRREKHTKQTLFHLDLRQEYELRKYRKANQTDPTHHHVDLTVQPSFVSRPFHDDNFFNSAPRASTANSSIRREKHLKTNNINELTETQPVTYSNMDKCALEIGQLVLQSILKKPELTVSDALNKFFIDSWLEKFNSSLNLSSKFSIELLSELQHMITEVTSLYSLEEGNERTKFRNKDYLSESMISKTLCGLGMEAYDRLLTEFENTNPVLHEIKRTLLPAIYSEFPFSEAFNGSTDLVHVERLFQDAESFISINNIDSLATEMTNKHKNQYRPKLDSLKGISENDQLSDANLQKSLKSLSGQKYVRFRTWHECYVEMKECYKQQEMRLSKFFSERDSLYKKIKAYEADIEEYESKYNNLSSEHNSTCEKLKSLQTNHDVLKTEMVRLQGLVSLREDENSKILKEFKDIQAIFQTSIQDSGNEFIQLLRQKYLSAQQAYDDLQTKYSELESTHQSYQEQVNRAQRYLSSVRSQQGQYKEQLMKISNSLARQFKASSMKRYHVKDDEIISLASSPLTSIVGPISQLRSPRLESKTDEWSMPEQTHEQLIDFLTQWNELLVSAIAMYQDHTGDLNNTIHNLHDHSLSNQADHEEAIKQLTDTHRDQLNKIFHEHDAKVATYQEQLQSSNALVSHLTSEISALEDENELLKGSAIRQQHNHDMQIRDKALDYKESINCLNDRISRLTEQIHMQSADTLTAERNIEFQHSNYLHKTDLQSIKDTLKLCDNRGAMALRSFNILTQRLATHLSAVPKELLSQLNANNLDSNKSPVASRRTSSIGKTRAGSQIGVGDFNDSTVSGAKTSLEEQITLAGNVLEMLTAAAIEAGQAVRRQRREIKRLEESTVQHVIRRGSKAIPSTQLPDKLTHSSEKPENISEDVNSDSDNEDEEDNNTVQTSDLIAYAFDSKDKDEMSAEERVVDLSKKIKQLATKYEELKSNAKSTTEHTNVNGNILINNEADPSENSELFNTMSTSSDSADNDQSLQSEGENRENREEREESETILNLEKERILESISNYSERYIDNKSALSSQSNTPSRVDTPHRNTSNYDTAIRDLPNRDTSRRASEESITNIGVEIGLSDTSISLNEYNARKPESPVSSKQEETSSRSAHPSPKLPVDQMPIKPAEYLQSNAQTQQLEEAKHLLSIVSNQLSDIAKQISNNGNASSSSGLNKILETLSYDIYDKSSRIFNSFPPVKISDYVHLNISLNSQTPHPSGPPSRHSTNPNSRRSSVTPSGMFADQRTSKPASARHSRQTSSNLKVESSSQSTHEEFVYTPVDLTAHTPLEPPSYTPSAFPIESVASQLESLPISQPVILPSNLELSLDKAQPAPNGIAINLQIPDSNFPNTARRTPNSYLPTGRLVGSFPSTPSQMLSSRVVPGSARQPVAPSPHQLTVPANPSQLIQSSLSPTPQSARITTLQPTTPSVMSPSVVSQQNNSQPSSLRSTPKTQVVPSRPASFQQPAPHAKASAYLPSGGEPLQAYNDDDGSSVATGETNVFSQLKHPQDSETQTHSPKLYSNDSVSLEAYLSKTLTEEEPAWLPNLYDDDGSLREDFNIEGFPEIEQIDILKEIVAHERKKYEDLAAYLDQHTSLIQSQSIDSTSSRELENEQAQQQYSQLPSQQQSQSNELYEPTKQSTELSHKLNNSFNETLVNQQPNLSVSKPTIPTTSSGLNQPFDKSTPNQSSSGVFSQSSIELSIEQSSSNQTDSNTSSVYKPPRNVGLLKPIKVDSPTSRSYLPNITSPMHSNRRPPPQLLSPKFRDPSTSSVTPKNQPGSVRAGQVGGFTNSRPSGPMYWANLPPESLVDTKTQQNVDPHDNVVSATDNTQSDGMNDLSFLKEAVVDCIASLKDLANYQLNSKQTNIYPFPTTQPMFLPTEHRDIYSDDEQLIKEVEGYLATAHDRRAKNQHLDLQQKQQASHRHASPPSNQQYLQEYFPLSTQLPSAAQNNTSSYLPSWQGVTEPLGWPQGIGSKGPYSNYRIIQNTGRRLHAKRQLQASTQPGNDLVSQSASQLPELTVRGSSPPRRPRTSDGRLSQRMLEHSDNINELKSLASALQEACRALTQNIHCNSQPTPQMPMNDDLGSSPNKQATYPTNLAVYYASSDVARYAERIYLRIQHHQYASHCLTQSLHSLANNHTDGSQEPAADEAFINGANINPHPTTHNTDDSRSARRKSLIANAKLTGNVALEDKIGSLSLSSASTPPMYLPPLNSLSPATKESNDVEQTHFDSRGFKSMAQTSYNDEAHVLTRRGSSALARRQKRSRFRHEPAANVDLKDNREVTRYEDAQRDSEDISPLVLTSLISGRNARTRLSSR